MPKKEIREKPFIFSQPEQVVQPVRKHKKTSVAISVLVYLTFWAIAIILFFYVFVRPIINEVIDPRFSDKFVQYSKDAINGRYGPGVDASQNIKQDTMDVKFEYDKKTHTVKIINSRIDEQTKKKIQAAIQKAAQEHNVKPQLIQAIITVESNFNHKAKGRLTKYGRAKGIMQLIPQTAQDLGVTDVYDIDQNINAGTKNIAHLLKRFKKLDLAIAAYNAGPTWVEKYNGIPPFNETVNYVREVKRIFHSL